ncbi:MAG: hypothetical protein ACI9KS_002894, partial [Sulfitobacter sp.]
MRHQTPNLATPGQFSPNSTALRTSFQKIVLIRANTAALWTTTPPPVWCAQIPTG